MESSSCDDLIGFHVPPRRWVVERTFAWISSCRRSVRDYEPLPEHHEAMVHLAMIMTYDASAGPHYMTKFQNAHLLVMPVTASR